jgi:hypothetical protein
MYLQATKAQSIDRADLGVIPASLDASKIIGFIILYLDNKKAFIAASISPTDGLANVSVLVLMIVFLSIYGDNKEL